MGVGYIIYIHYIHETLVLYNKLYEFLIVWSIINGTLYVYTMKRDIELSVTFYYLSI